MQKDRENEVITVIEGGEGAGINVEVGVNLDRGDLETHCLEEETGGGGDNTLADTRDDTSGDENVLLDHGCLLVLECVYGKEVKWKGKGEQTNGNKG